MLFSELARLRAFIAQEEGRQPYLILHDNTLRGIAEKRPLTQEALLAVKGIGAAKAAKYGAGIIALVREAEGKGKRK
jgi:ATP-dependent DNA helicase RecQ